MRAVFFAAIAILFFAGVSDIASAQGAPGPGATIYDFPPRGRTLPRGTRGFYLRRSAMPDCPNGIYWVRLGRGNMDSAKHRARTTTCAR
jgi:hypothetical protein